MPIYNGDIYKMMDKIKIIIIPLLFVISITNLSFAATKDFSLHMKISYPLPSYDQYSFMGYYVYIDGSLLMTVPVSVMNSVETDEVLVSTFDVDFNLICGKESNFFTVVAFGDGDGDGEILSSHSGSYNMDLPCVSVPRDWDLAFNDQGIIILKIRGQESYEDEAYL